MTSAKKYVPALRYPWLTRWYDAVLASLFPEQKIKRLLIKQAEIEVGMQVLDFGVGTGTLAIMAKQAAPGAQVVGLDVDPEVLALARKKIMSSGSPVELVQYDGTELPFPDAIFDRVLTCLVLHHLLPEQKAHALEELTRVLKPGASLHLADWCKPANPLMRALFLLVQALDGFATTRDHAAGRLPQFLKQAGYHPVHETGRRNTLFGTMRLYHCTKPRS